MSNSQSLSSLLHLPEGFPGSTKVPKFHLGDRVCFIPLPTQDYGIIIGLQFVPTECLQDWAWRYTLWFDPQSPSHAWIDLDLAWEDDLQLLTPAPTHLLSQE